MFPRGVLMILLVVEVLEGLPFIATVSPYMVI
jgi:hypothetical protein